MFINQDGKALKHAYTRDNPNGMPDMEQVTVNGSPVWDDSKRLVFLQEMVDTKIIPELQKLEFAPVEKTALELEDEVVKKAEEQIEF